MTDEWVVVTVYSGGLGSLPGTVYLYNLSKGIQTAKNIKEYI